MDTSKEKQVEEHSTVERRLRDEVFLLDPFYRKFFNYAMFDKNTNSLHGSRYSLHYSGGLISIR
jgi:hypothetical protein